MAFASVTTATSGLARMTASCLTRHALATARAAIAALAHAFRPAIASLARVTLAMLICLTAHVTFHRGVFIVFAAHGNLPGITRRRYPLPHVNSPNTLAGENADTTQAMLHLPPNTELSR